DGLAALPRKHECAAHDGSSFFSFGRGLGPQMTIVDGRAASRSPRLSTNVVQPAGCATSFRKAQANEAICVFAAIG
ncbi:MAG: hypothetical protein Q7J32_09325, partial [Sphingomonadaceae bacterium]|nr:hypothetical protein [Sphingomonadaceae bacterium]